MNVPRTLSRRTLLAGLASGIALRTLGVAACTSDDSPAVSGSPATATYEDADILIDAERLAQQIDDPALRIIDCSEARAYSSGHIPRASHVWWQDTIEINSSTYGMLAGIETRRTLFRQAGIEPDSRVVVYDDDGGTFGARFLWMLHMTGFERVALLDGGRQAWERAGFELTDEGSERLDGSFEGNAVDEPNAHAHDIERWIERDDIAVLDTRTASERSETWYGRLRVGKIPGSAWLPRERFFGEPGSPFLAPRTELLDRLTTAGIAPDVLEIIVYGLHSTLAALPYVALRALGTPHVRVYDGSWAEWGASDRPIESI